MKQVKNAFEKYKKKLLAPEQKIVAFFAREMYPLYQHKQLERFQSSGSSEGGAFTFPFASDKTIARKLRDKELYPNKYPGGRKRLVHTGTLVSSVIGNIPSSEFSGRGKKFHRREITSKSMKVMTTVPYGQYVVDWMDSHGKQSFMKFGTNTKSEFKLRIKEFLRREFIQ